jgi:hypothetical protein
MTLDELRDAIATMERVLEAPGCFFITRLIVDKEGDDYRITSVDVQPKALTPKKETIP